MKTDAKQIFGNKKLLLASASPRRRELLGLIGVEVCQAVSDVFALTVSIPIGMSVIKEMKEEDISSHDIRKN